MIDTQSTPLLCYNKYVIINISAPWCKPCKEIKPKLEKFLTVIDKNDFIYLKIDHELYSSDYNFESLFNVSKSKWLYG